MYCICTDIRDKGLSLLVAMEHDLQHILLVVLCPCANGQFSDLNTGRAESGSIAIHQVLGRLHMGYGASEVLVPRLLCVCYKDQHIKQQWAKKLDAAHLLIC